MRKSKADQLLVDLYSRHAQHAGRLAFLLTGDKHAAEDITQEAFVRVGARMMTLRNPDGAAGYLFRTVTNLARGHGRGLNKQRSLRHRLDPPHNEEPPDFETQQEMWQRLIALPARQRVALFLRYYVDMSEADAARSLDCSTEAIKSLTHRAIENLRKEQEGMPL